MVREEYLESIWSDNKFDDADFNNVLHLFNTCEDPFTDELPEPGSRIRFTSGQFTALLAYNTRQSIRFKPAPKGIVRLDRKNGWSIPAYRADVRIQKPGHGCDLQ